MTTYAITKTMNIKAYKKGKKKKKERKRSKKEL